MFRKTTSRPQDALLIALSAALLVGCAAGSTDKPPPPPYKPSADSRSQASEFIAANNQKKRGNSNKLALTSCNVVFGVRTGGNSSTHSGMFEPTAGTLQAKIAQWYELEGVSDAQMQSITDRICADAEQQLQQAGFELMPQAQLLATSQYQELAAKGRPGPVAWEVAKSEYKVFAPTGRTVFDQRFDSGAKGIANIFKAATRSNPDALEGKLVNELGITGAHVDYIVDFASVAGRDDSKGVLGRMAGQDQAEVTSTVELAISGSLKLVTPESIHCHKLGCDTNNAIWPAYQSKRPLIAQGKFHNGLRDAQSTANKIGEGIANVVGFLAAMSGGSGSSLSISEWAVDADPQAYGQLAEQYSNGFIKMAALSARP